jgi:hypothetical protein
MAMPILSDQIRSSEPLKGGMSPVVERSARAAGVLPGPKANGYCTSR